MTEQKNVNSMPIRGVWSLDPAITFLNHGSFGACPKPVLDQQTNLRAQMESEPVRFFVKEVQGLLDESRKILARFVGATTADLAFVPNATYAINSVLRTLTIEPGDELLTTNHEYNACRNALEFVAQRSGARVTVAEIPFPITSADQVLEAVVGRVTDKTRLALIDHITSQTGLVFPIEEIVAKLDALGIDTLVDGAHGPGMLRLGLTELGAAYYTGNLHKWVCAPKGAAFLFARSDKRSEVRPLAISHGANAATDQRSRFHLEFDYTGTDDLSAYVCVKAAIEFMGSLLPGGWPALLENNRKLALKGRQIICRKLGLVGPCPDEMIGSLAAIAISDGLNKPQKTPLYSDPLQDRLLDDFKIEVPIIPWPAPPKRIVRISAQVYNQPSDYQKLADALYDLL
jgi:isopenicillin-N epimerase